MAKKKKHGAPHEEENGEAWLLPYSDLMTLLLALFIALFAISQTDQKKVTQLAQAFSAAFNMGGPSFFDGAGPNVSQMRQIMSDEDQGNQAFLAENNQLEQIKKELDEYIEQNNLEDQLSTELADEGLMIRIKEKALFPSGSAELVGDAQKIGPVVAGLLANIPQRVLISGHTDNVPINTPQYPSNWELSSYRALNFMKYLLSINNGLNPARFSAQGYSEYRPIASNDDEIGRTKNRRVEILISRNYHFDPHEAERKALKEKLGE